VARAVAHRFSPLSLEQRPLSPTKAEPNDDVAVFDRVPRAAPLCVAARVDRIIGERDIRIGEATDDVEEGIDLIQVGEKSRPSAAVEPADNPSGGDRVKIVVFPQEGRPIKPPLNPIRFSFLFAEFKDEFYHAPIMRIKLSKRKARTRGACAGGSLSYLIAATSCACGPLSPWVTVNSTR